MSVDTTDRKVTHEMDSEVTEYAFTFRALVSAPSDIKCIRTDLENEADEDMEYLAEALPDPTEDDILKYIVEINEDGVGGTVTVQWPSTSDYTLTIYRETTQTQGSAYSDFNQFPASTVESNFDKLTLIAQENSESISRALRVPVTYETDAQLPAPSGGAFIGWNDDGDALENKELPDPSTLEKATQADAEAGTNNEKFMTPLRTQQQIDGNSLTAGPESTTEDNVPQWDEATNTLKDGLTVGTEANNLVQLDGDAKLPAVDGSQLTNMVPAGFAHGCRVYRDGNQAITYATDTKVQLNAETYDIGSEFDSTTNYRFTATTAGYYLVVGQVDYGLALEGTYGYAYIYKNGEAITQTVKSRESTDIGCYIPIQDIVYLAVNDYIELYVKHIDGSNNRNVVGGSTLTYLSIHRIY